MTESRRFPPPWTVDEATESFCIRDANGRRDEPTDGDAPLDPRRIALNMTKLPERRNHLPTGGATIAPGSRDLLTYVFK